MPVHLQLPERPCSEPIIIITIQYDRRIIPDALSTEEALEGGLADDLTPNRIAKLRLPIPTKGSRHVSLSVRGSVDIDFNDTNLWISEVGCDPLSRNEDIGVCIRVQDSLLLFWS